MRVLIADDSRFMRGILSRALRDAGFDVVGEAADGDEALALCRSLKPDTMTLDLAMPGTDGIAVLKALRAGGNGLPRVPAVVVSAFSPAHGARAVDALSEGAFELAAKPAVGEPFATFAAELADKLRAAAASAGTLGKPKPKPKPDATAPAARAPRTARALRPGTKRFVIIACSTGGPRALAELVPKLPSPLGAGSVIVQHMPPGFTGSLAARLDRSSPLDVREADATSVIEPGAMLLAPGGSHLRLTGERSLSLTDEAAIGGLRPRADLTILDAAKIWGERLLLVVLTGMGKDGLEGAEQVRARGGRILVEAERTCTVYGMPRAVAEADLADEILDLGDLPAAIAAEAVTS